MDAMMPNVRSQEGAATSTRCMCMCVALHACCTWMTAMMAFCSAFASMLPAATPLYNTSAWLPSFFAAAGAVEGMESMSLERPDRDSGRAAPTSPSPPAPDVDAPPRAGPVCAHGQPNHKRQQCVGLGVAMGDGACAAGSRTNLTGPHLALGQVPELPGGCTKRTRPGT